MKKIFQKLLGAAAAAALALPATAVQHPNLERGFDVQKAFQMEEIDSVNLFNGNMALNIPLGQQFQGEGNLSYRFSAVYNSKTWDWEIAGMVSGDDPINVARASRTSNAGFGWRVSLGDLYDPNSVPTITSPAWTYVTPDGAEHQFYPTLTGSNRPCTAPSPAACFSRDGSFLRLTPGNPGEMVVAYPDGTQHVFARIVLGNKVHYRLSRIQDVYNNKLSINSSGNPWILTETSATGTTLRTHYIHFTAAEIYDTGHVPMVSRLELAAFGGTTANYVFNYQRTPVVRPILHDNRSQLPNPVSLPLLSGITLPDNSSYSMPVATSYQLDLPSGNGDIPGVLLKIGLPTGGRIEWSYVRWSFPTGESYNPSVPPRNQPDFVTRSSGVSARRVYDIDGSLLGTWTYRSFLDDPAPISQMPVQKRTEVTDPRGHRTMNYFSVYQDNSLNPPPDASFNYYGLPITTEQNDGSARRRFLSQEVFAAGATTPMRRIYLAFDIDTGNEASPEGIPSRRQASTRIDYLDNGTTYQTVDFTNYDGLGHYRSRKTSGNFLSGGSAENDREEFTNWSGTLPDNGTPWILGIFTESWQTERGETSKQEFCFEATTGFLKRERQIRLGTTRTTTDVITEHGRDNLGNTTFEKLFGGDQQAVSTGSALCDMGLPATPAKHTEFVHRYGSLESKRPAGANFFLEKYDVDANTGLAAASYDISDLKTLFLYDNMGRITWAKPDANHDGWRNFIYTQANGTTRAKIRHLVYNNNTTTGAIQEEESHFDGFGRIYQEKRKFGGATQWSVRETQHDAQGNMTEQTTWTTNPATAGRAYYRELDPFGRPKYFDPAEGSHHRVEFFYEGERRVARQYWVGYARSGTGAIAERKAGTSEEFDLYGRLRRVEEGSINNHPKDLIAEYSYTVDGDLARVLTRPRDNTSSQVRTFTWDRRGFLLSEENPENGKWNYSSYDAGGNFARKSHAAQATRALGFEYDSFERLIRVKNDSTGVPLKEWTYGTANTAGNRKLGKVEVAKRYNYARVPWNPGVTATIEVRDTFTYGGRGGRVSARRTELPAFSRSFDQSWTYDSLGMVATLGYPRCSFAFCTATAVPARTITNQYTQGNLTRVVGWASLGYHDNGMVSEVRHQSGMLDTYDRDPVGLPRVYNVKVQHPGRLPAQLGRHEYDGMGHLVRRRLDSTFEAIEGVAGDQEEGGAVGQAPEEEPAAVVGIRENYYVYDDLGRLTHFNDGSGRSQSYTYDPYANLTSVSDFNGTTTVSRAIPASIANNRLGIGYSYDVAGNMTVRSLGASSDVFEYDLLNDVVSRNFPAETYAYNIDGERIYSFFYQVGQPGREEYALRDMDGQLLTLYQKVDVVGGGEQWSWLKDYIYRDSQLLGAAQSHTNALLQELHFSLDHLGTPRVTSDKQGSFPAVAVHHYLGFGEEYAGTVGDGEKMRFAGQERAQGAAGVADDLDYLHARYYAPHLGRFLSVDPAKNAELNRPSTWNRYSYAWNDPLGYVDSDGENPADVSGKMQIVVTGKYIFQRFPYDSAHGGAHIHVYERKGGKLIARVTVAGGKVLKEKGKIPKVPKKALKQAAKRGLIRLSAKGILAFLTGGFSTLVTEVAMADDINEGAFDDAPMEVQEWLREDTEETGAEGEKTEESEKTEDQAEEPAEDEEENDETDTSPKENEAK